MPKNKFSLISSSRLAEICKVSQGTVDRALNNRTGISPKTKQRILDAAKLYGYLPNINAGSLSAGKSNLFGIVIFDLYNDYFSRFVMDFEKICKNVGYNSVVMFSHNDLQTEIGCINQLAHIGVDGIILCSVGMGDEYRISLRSLKIPIITIGNRIPGIPFIGINDFEAMKDITLYVIRKNYLNLIYYAPVLNKRGQQNISAQEERYRGFLEGLQMQNMSGTLITNEDTLLERLLENQKTAVICPSDSYAIRTYNIARYHHCDNVGIIGFDNCDMLKKGKIDLDSLFYDREKLANLIYLSLIEPPKENALYIPHSILSRGSI